MVTVHGSPAPGAVLRAVVATAEIFTFSTLAHVGAGGRLPSPGQCVVLAALLFGASLLALRRAIRVRAAVALVAAAQVGLHLAFTQTTTPMGHHLHASGSPSLLEALHLDARMALAHVLTTFVALLVLVTQERLAIVVCRWVAPTWRPVVGRTSGAIPVAERAVTHRLLMLISAEPHRGPPRFC